jgi:hypothetical protein
MLRLKRLGVAAELVMVFCELFDALILQFRLTKQLLHLVGDDAHL